MHRTVLTLLPLAHSILPRPLLKPDKWENPDIEKFSKEPKVTRLGGGRAQKELLQSSCRAKTRPLPPPRLPPHPPASSLFSQEASPVWRALAPASFLIPLQMGDETGSDLQALLSPAEGFGLCPEGNRKPPEDLGRKETGCCSPEREGRVDWAD